MIDVSSNNEAVALDPQLDALLPLPADDGGAYDLGEWHLIYDGHEFVVNLGSQMPVANGLCRPTSRRQAGACQRRP